VGKKKKTVKTVWLALPAKLVDYVRTVINEGEEKGVELWDTFSVPEKKSYALHLGDEAFAKAVVRAVEAVERAEARKTAEAPRGPKPKQEPRQQQRPIINENDLNNEELQTDSGSGSSSIEEELEQRELRVKVEEINPDRGKERVKTLDFLNQLVRKENWEIKDAVDLGILEEWLE
jgi:hypothetical protein